MSIINKEDPKQSDELTMEQTVLEKYFEEYRNNIIGKDVSFISPYGEKKIIYADWIASGRLYGPIEQRISEMIGAFSACSNVTGYKLPYFQLAKIMHEFNGLCFIDFAASAPYVEINMHPGNLGEDLDAIYFSPHKFLGGPGSSGVLIFNKNLYRNLILDHPGGGTVNWTNRWNEYSYITDVEAREDGGTPGFLQAFKAALCILLKEKMGVEKIQNRENELLVIALNELKSINGLHILAENVKDRLGVISFYIENIHHNLVSKLLNDLYGIQVRGGCSCAGTYGHFLLNVDWETSHDISRHIDHGDLSLKPGWIRISFHPTMTNEELYTITGAIRDISVNYRKYAGDYNYDNNKNEFFHKNHNSGHDKKIQEWFQITT